MGGISSSFQVAVVLLACAVSAQFPPGWNYNPFDYYPYTALQPPVQETAEVAAARAAHMAAHAAARGVAVPQILVGSPYVPQDTPEVWAAKAEHYRAYAAAAAANGVIVNLPALQPYYQSYVPQDTPEVWAAKQEFFRAYNEAAARAAQ